MEGDRVWGAIIVSKLKTNSSGLDSLTETGKIDSSQSAPMAGSEWGESSEQSKCSKAASVAVTEQEQDSQTASIAVTVQDEESQVASIAVTGQDEKSQTASIAVTGREITDGLHSRDRTRIHRRPP